MVAVVVFSIIPCCIVAALSLDFSLKAQNIREIAWMFELTTATVAGMHAITPVNF